MTFDKEIFETLLKENRYDEAKAMLDEAFATAPPKRQASAEQGKYLTELALAKLKLSNASSRRYKEKLEQVVAGLKELKRQQEPGYQPPPDPYLRPTTIWGKIRLVLCALTNRHPDPAERKRFAAKKRSPSSAKGKPV